MLKPIPVEERSFEKLETKEKPSRPSKQKLQDPFTIRPISHGGHDDHFLKNMCSHFVDFLNRGTKYTIQQIDELIMSLQRSVLRLQKKKHQIIQQQRESGHQNGMKNFGHMPIKKKRIS